MWVSKGDARSVDYSSYVLFHRKKVALIASGVRSASLSRVLT